MDLTSNKILLGAGGAGGAGGGAPTSYFIAEFNASTNSNMQGMGVDVKTVGTNVDNIYVITTHLGLGGSIILKLDYLGSVQWARNFASSANALFTRSIAVNPSNGDVYLAGSINVTNHGTDGYLAKYNDSGTFQWQRQCQDSQASLSYANQLYNKIGLDNSGNIYVFGEGSHSAQNTSFKQGLLTKYNSSGVRQWQRRLEDSRGMTPNSGFVTSSGDCYITGTFSDPTIGYYGVGITAKYNSSGTLQWQKKNTEQYNSSYTGVSNQYINIDNSGNIYRAGHFSPGLYGYNTTVLVTKENTSGTIVWNSMIGQSTGSILVRSSCIDSQGNVYLVSEIINPDVNTPRCSFIVKLNSSGVVQWQRTLNAGYRANPYDITVDSNDDIVLTGWYQNISGGVQGTFVAKLPSDGSLTGTHGSWTYQARNFSTASGSTTLSSSSYTDGASSFVDIAGTWNYANFTSYSLNKVNM